MHLHFCSEPDYLYDDPTLIQTAKDSFVEQMELAKNLSINTVAINHDILYQTSYNLTNYMLDYMKFLNYGTSVTVGECLGDPPENWYRTAGGAPPAAALVSPEITCDGVQCTEHVYIRNPSKAHLWLCQLILRSILYLPHCWCYMD